MKQISFHLTDIEIKKLKSISAKTGLSVSEIVRRLIDEHLEKEVKEK